MSSDIRRAKRIGAWCIVMGVVAIAAGVSVGVGCLISGGSLLKNAH